ncbi:MAG: acetyl-CoA carboxylase biotin carboxyl carrier protein subunit [Deferribacteraceae bacterium]|jgi:biotin carboxyl carrier protein|nr:acetyl-CoA carboxylase biotin carboxyl carrier protein subunit [Deferribacteraceae bacterium]
MKLRVKVNGVDFDVEVEQIDEGKPQALHPAPLYAPVAPRPAAVHAPAAPAAASTEGVLSPVSGTILDIKCKPGDKVKPGVPLLTIDSMKMETTVPSDREGEVLRIAVQKGEAVREGQLLVAFS